MKLNFDVDKLGPCKISSPLQSSHFVGDDERILYDITMKGFRKAKKLKGEPLSFEVSGPRSKIYFDPMKTRVGIVTCGGLCPGINDVIRGLVMELWYMYGVRNIVGFKYGYQGMSSNYCHEPMEMNPEMVSEIHRQGGSMLSSSRGPQDLDDMLDNLERMNVSILFAIGGDGTQRGALAIHEAAKKRNYKLAVVGIPKTIDNDLCFIEKSFGFETAFSAASESIVSAHNEAKGAPNGIGLVKLMGRNSGFIAANAALAMSYVNIVLIPEVPFKLEGGNGLLKYVEKRLLNRKHAVIVLAEGAGQELMETKGHRKQKDASGNLRLMDIGLFLKDQFNEYFKNIGMEANIKYIDPSYIIRSIPANPSDSVYCMLLAQNAVHAAMAGRSGMVVGQWNNTFTDIPIKMATMERNEIDPESQFWNNVLEATGQPSHFE